MCGMDNTSFPAATVLLLKLVTILWCNMFPLGILRRFAFPEFPLHHIISYIRKLWVKLTALWQSLPPAGKRPTQGPYIVLILSLHCPYIGLTLAKLHPTLAKFPTGREEADTGSLHCLLAARHSVTVTASFIQLLTVSKYKITNYYLRLFLGGSLRFFWDRIELSLYTGK